MYVTGWIDTQHVVYTYMKYREALKRNKIVGRLGGSVGWATNFSSGHDLTVHEFKPCVGLCADSNMSRDICRVGQVSFAMAKPIPRIYPLSFPPIAFSTPSNWTWRTLKRHAISPAHISPLNSHNYPINQCVLICQVAMTKHCTGRVAFKQQRFRGAWVAWLVKHLTLAQVMISQFTSLSRVSGSVPSDSMSLPLSAPPLLVLSLSQNR